MISGRGGGHAPKHGRIRPPRRMLKPITGHSTDPDDIEGPWQILREAMMDIHQKNCSKLAFEHLYRAGYKIVLNRKGEVLYDRVRNFERDYFAQNVIPKIEALVTTSLVNIAMGRAGASANERREMSENFLRRIRESWEDHNTAMNMIADILMYLDRGFIQDTGRPSIYTSTIGLYRDHILRASLHASAEYTVSDILNFIMVDLINMERDGDVIDRYLIRSCIRMLDSLYETDQELDHEKLYFTSFEPVFLRTTDAYYDVECEKLFRKADALAWLRHTDRRLQEEEDRCDTTIHRATLPKCVKIVEERLIAQHLADFLKLDSGIVTMLDNDSLEELAILYRLVGRVDPKKAVLHDHLVNRIVAMGLEIEQTIKNTDFANQVAAAADGEDGGGGGGGDAGPGAAGPGAAAAAAADGTDKPNKAPSAASAAAQQTAAAIKWVDDVLHLKAKFDTIWEKCFEKDLDVQAMLTKGFSTFINRFARASEYLSLFIDDNLRRGIRGKTEKEIDEVLDKAITLLRYIQDRDMFERYYQKHLAKRLLLSKSESQDAETAMVSRMKDELGHQFTTKFEGMFRDMKTSAEITSNYRTYIRDLGDAGDQAQQQPELAVNILTTNCWPPEMSDRKQVLDSAAPSQLVYPREIEAIQKSLTSFYLTTRSGRKLTWVSSIGNADMRCTFPAVPGAKGPLARERRYELNVSTTGMIVLMLFNDVGNGEGDGEGDGDGNGNGNGNGEALSFEEIRGRTGIPTNDLLRTLSSLAIPPKSRVLLKEPAGRRVETTDRFRFNAGFVSKTVRIKAPIVNATAKAETDKERKDTEEKNTLSRSHIIDAAIVRTMKQRKELKHSQLISEVVGQLVGRFNPEVSLIKKRIEDLIAREYLARMENIDVPTYQYLA
ncbi:cullin-3 [Sodiomyces alkalinus F11]|uniref:Cullin-3 n=1 Tax=Sodiomyces alkalinus (strain CBS 110278 / VKM F-3762 / F11) TaxID=1314773 RepID=A0A3N2PRZ0_SODAK|nr:cullin-3 [Sodiomyces alkalinus F11]ROT37194.1 cullin-3 [Sodiomyces alkalinus F11]